MIPMRFWHPLTALLGGLITVLLVRLLIPAEQAAALAHDIAVSTGFPVATTTIVPDPWGTVMLGLGAAWVVWACIEIPSFLVQLSLLAAGLALLLTGAWIANLGGGTFPTVPVMVAMVIAFILGQFAVGFSGDPARHSLHVLLDGTMGMPQLQQVLSQPSPPANMGMTRVLAMIEPCPEDAEFLPTLIHGLKVDGAWVRAADDGRLQVVFGLFDDGEEMDGAPAWAALARAADAMAARPHVWRLASMTGRLNRVIQLTEPAGLHLRGHALLTLARWLEDAPSAANGDLVLWLAAVPEGIRVPGWSASGDAADPVRLRPAQDRPNPA